jgi:hypothetical protein
MIHLIPQDDRGGAVEDFSAPRVIMGGPDKPGHDDQMFGEVCTACAVQMAPSEPHAAPA